MMSDTPKGNGPAPVQVTVHWDNNDLAAHPVQAANAFILQGAGHEVVFTIGFAVPPFYASPVDAAKVRSIPAKTIARIALTPARMAEIVQIMQQALAAVQSATKS
jgi:hypothetical protein